MVFCAVRSPADQATMWATNRIVPIPTYRAQRRRRRGNVTGRPPWSPLSSSGAAASWHRCVIPCWHLIWNNDLVIRQLFLFSLLWTTLFFLLVVFIRIVVVVIVIFVIVVWVIAASARRCVAIPT